MNGLVPVLNCDQSVADWKRILSKLTAGAAAETVVANFLYDRFCDYGTSVKVLRRVLQAWAELHSNGLVAEGRQAPNNLASDCFAVTAQEVWGHR
jgi:hypothetical protein